ncbi:MAG: hypothetical protein CMD31_04545 [Flavobacteriales bacterium]|jgi:uncharacterized protein DUF4157|nr:hypothetical protein [Flavobacteriales bacterium]|tara:strand:+ start:38262 stop:39977 length:1716 start_codon:yes stop_codon:yes gene_type:complete
MIQSQTKLKKEHSLISSPNSTSKNKQAVQFKDNRPESTTQLKVQQMANNAVVDAPIQRRTNKTGMPDSLKSGIENLSGLDMSDVKVHYNSSQPAQLQAHAFAQGNQIHIASGQERHLPHEAWHVVQQKQGRVAPTKQLKGKININDDAGLEKEADVMGAKAVQKSSLSERSNYPSTLKSTQSTHTIQRNVTVRDPERNYNNLHRLVMLVRNAIMSVVDEHREEPFYQRVAKDMEFFFQIVKELFESNPVYDKMKDFTDEIIQTGLAKSDLDPNKYTKEEWALLHRMESKSFLRFVNAKEGQEHEEGVKAIYEETNSKYNPTTFGARHTWESNTEWLMYVLEHFPKLVITDVPLTINNIFRQKSHTSMIAKEGERDFRFFSAYGREIAALLYEGYVPISTNTVGRDFKAPITAITMINQRLLPPTVLDAVLKRVKVNLDVAKWISKGVSLNDLGRGIGEKLIIKKALSFFHHAGIPTTIEELGDFTPGTSGYQEKSWANRNFRPTQEVPRELSPEEVVIQYLREIIPSKDFDWDEKNDWKALFARYSSELKAIGINGWTGLKKQATIHKRDL